MPGAARRCVVDGPGRPLGSDPASGVRFPTRRTGPSPLRPDQQHTCRRPGAVHGGARGRLHYSDRFDVLGAQVVEPQRPGSDGAPRKGLEVVLRLVNPDAIDEYDGRMVAEQRLHTAHTDARPHTRQPRPLHDHHSRHARAQEIREVSHAPLADQAGRINDRPLGWGGDLLARCCGGAVGRTLAAKRPAK